MDWRKSMKAAGRFLAAVIVFFCLASLANAQCTGACLTSFSISPSTIAGNNSDFATGTVQANVVNPQYQTLNIYIQTLPNTPGGTRFICVAGQYFSGNPGGCSYPVSPGT